MGDLTKDTPKPLLKLENDDQTLLIRSLRSLPQQINKAFVVGGYQGSQIQAYLREIKNVATFLDLEYVNQPHLNGTADALFACKDKLKDKFLVIMGDDLYSQDDLEKLAREPLGILVSRLVKDDPSYENAIVKVEGGKLANIVERQPGKKGDLVNAGAYILNKDFFKYPPVLAENHTSEYGLPQTLLQMVKDGHKFSVVEATFWKKISTPEDLRLAT